MTIVIAIVTILTILVGLIFVLASLTGGIVPIIGLIVLLVSSIILIAGLRRKGPLLVVVGALGFILVSCFALNFLSVAINFTQTAAAGAGAKTGCNFTMDEQSKPYPDGLNKVTDKFGKIWSFVCVGGQPTDLKFVGIESGTPVPTPAPTSTAVPYVAPPATSTFLPTSGPVVMPTNPVVAPPATSIATTGSCLSVADFVTMWNGRDKSNPGVLIQKLDTAFEQNGGKIGTQWPTGPMSVSPVSLVWTDTLRQPVTLSNGSTADASKWVPINVQGGWGVYLVYDTVKVPTPGRSAKLCTSLNPAVQLPGWNS